MYVFEVLNEMEGSLYFKLENLVLNTGFIASRPWVSAQI